RLAELLEGDERDLLLGVELEQRNVDALGLLEVLDVLLVDARGAEEQRLLELLGLELRDLVLALLDLIGRDGERLGDAPRVRAETDRALHGQGGLAVRRIGEEQIDPIVELLVRDALLRLLAG